MRLDMTKAAPEAYQAMLQLQKYVNQSGLEKPLQELVKIRASQMNGCAFCIDLHVREAVKAGESHERLHLLNAWREAPIYTDREQAALEWTEAMTRLGPHGVPEEVYERARSQFNEKELVNLTMTIVTINGWNRLMIGFRRPPDVSYRPS